MFLKKKEKGLVISRNVNIYLHKPLKNKEQYKNSEETIKALKEQELIVQHEFIANDVVDGGEIWIAELLAGRDTAGTPLVYTAGNLGLGLQYIAVGTSSVAVTQNDFKLGTLATGTNNSKPATTSFIGAGANNKFTVSVTFLTTEANDASPLREAGIFSDDQDVSVPTSETDVANRMFNRTVFSAITKTTDFELTIQWTIEIGALTA